MTPKIRNFLIGTAIVAVLALIGTSVLWQWVPAGRVAIVYNANRGVDRNRVLTPGRYALSPLDQLIVTPTSIVPAFYSQDPSLGERSEPDGIEITTKQGATTFDILVLYRIQKENVWKVFDNFARQPIEVIQSSRIRREVKNGANVVSREFFLEELIGKERNKANGRLTEVLKEALSPLGFTVDRAFFVTAYPNENLAKQFVNIETADIYRQIAATNAQIATKQKEITITRAKAEQRASQLLASTATEKSNALLQLDIERLEAEKWDGSKIKVDTTGLTSVFIDPNALKGLASK